MEALSSWQIRTLPLLRYYSRAVFQTGCTHVCNLRKDILKSLLCAKYPKEYKETVSWVLVLWEFVDNWTGQENLVDNTRCIEHIPTGSTWQWLPHRCHEYYRHFGKGKCDDMYLKRLFISFFINIHFVQFFFLLSLSLACFLDIKELSVLRVNEAELILASSFMQHYLALITV